MRWITYLILGYLVLGVQVGFAGFVNVGGAAPNLVLLAAIFIALNAPRDPALLGCLTLGILQDLLTQQTLGIHAFSYGLVAMFVISTQAIVYREHPLTHASLALAGMTIVSMVMLVQGWVWLEKSSRLSPLTLMYSTICTVLVSPVMLGMLGRVKFLFGFQPVRRVRI
jgi:rod shape-determining protein MreD